MLLFSKCIAGHICGGRSIEPPKAVKGHATSNCTNIDGIVLNVTKNRGHCAHFCIIVQDRPYHRSAGMGSPTLYAKAKYLNFKFSNVEHYAVYVVHALSPPLVARCAIGGGEICAILLSYRTANFKTSNLQFVTFMYVGAFLLQESANLQLKNSYAIQVYIPTVNICPHNGSPYTLFSWITKGETPLLSSSKLSCKNSRGIVTLAGSVSELRLVKLTRSLVCGNSSEVFSPIWYCLARTTEDKEGRPCSLVMNKLKP